MALKAWHHRWIGVSLLLVGVPLPAISQVQTPPLTANPVKVGVEYTPERTVAVDNNAYVLGQQSDYLPEAVPKADRIVLRLSDRRVYVYDDERVLDSFPVAIGAPETPTPVGEFEISQMIVDPAWQSPWTGEVFAPGANSALGLRWIGFTELPNGVIGFHGTPTVSSIGRAVSNGCVRLTNEDVLALYAYVEVGMTVVVEP
ncbi:L,D-transpeptidase [Oscillatoria sp. CS-180]|uniref:L,D-transpeptidase n=1 Tax=Oscillatoria sp. CS-180 TaxID=3021720 RepID=UPI00232B2D3C|nr:L,D-transpeptidase [Oscillatoria sp. CS-180]MDB9528880.1 L,D-transpeptidase [Oscillatoria sp. CS-180]